MNIQLKTILFTACMLTGTASADHAPAAPDFQHRAPHGHAREVTSNARTMLAPIDIIPFDFDSSKLTTIDHVQVRQAARWLKQHPKHRLVIEGHTDAVGNDVYNVGLATRRANAVRDAIIALGVSPDRVVAVIYGEAKPRSRDPIAAANRVVVLYATTLTPREIASIMLPIGSAVVWS